MRDFPDRKFVQRFGQKANLAFLLTTASVRFEVSEESRQMIYWRGLGDLVQKLPDPGLIGKNRQLSDSGCKRG